MILSSHREALLGAAPFLQQYPGIDAAKAGARIESVAMALDAGELWTFTRSRQSWRDLAARAGIALVRNGQIIDRLVTMMD